MLRDSRLDAALTILAAAFLAAYAWPILQPDVSEAGRLLCRVVIAATWVAFAADYVRRLVGATQRGRWFVWHLLDLLVLVLPLLRPLRLLRVVTLLNVMSRSGSSTLRGRVGVYVASGSALLGTVGALAVLDAERGVPGSNIESFGDALWWAATTMSTVGYGDSFPVTPTGRCVAVGLMVCGVALLGTASATIASWLIESVTQDMAEASEVDAAAQSSELASLREEVRQMRAEMSAFFRSDPGVLRE